MRAIRNSLAAFLLIAFAAISVVGLMATFPTFGGRFTRITDTGAAIVAVWRSHGLFWLWLGLLVSTVATLILSVALARRRSMVEVEMEEGRVVILETAIRKYIRQALAGIPGVTGHQIRLKQSRKGLHIDIYAHVRTDDKLPQIENAIINRVKEAMSEDLGVKSVSAVHVYIRDFEIATKAAPRIETEQVPAPRPEEPSSGEEPQLSRLKVLSRDDEETPASVEEPAPEQPSEPDLLQAGLSEVPLEVVPPPPPEAEEAVDSPRSTSKGWGLFRRKKAETSERPAEQPSPGQGPAQEQEIAATSADVPEEPQTSETATEETEGDKDSSKTE